MGCYREMLGEWMSWWEMRCGGVVAWGVYGAVVMNS